jgi:hypothetical protein
MTTSETLRHSCRVREVGETTWCGLKRDVLAITDDGRFENSTMAVRRGVC